jgi:hypothetical protein
MSSVWVCFPSKRPPEVVNSVLQAWHDMGYSSCVQRDMQDSGVKATEVQRWAQPYPGWGASMNILAREIFGSYPQCDWVVAASDDIYPDPNVRAEEIAQQCSGRFYNTVELTYPPAKPKWSHIPFDVAAPGGSGSNAPSWKYWSTFGVVQPIGDLKAWPASRIDRICGSPWLGREFCRRMYQGNGPFWPEYRHMHDDEELFEVSKKLGVLWQREDLTHRHEHWGRKSLAQRSDIPEFLREANSQENWKRTQTLFNQRKAAGFPGHEPIA